MDEKGFEKRIGLIVEDFKAFGDIESLEINAVKLYADTEKELEG